MHRVNNQDPLEAFVEVRCLCGQLHSFLREKVVEGLAVSRWKCGGCKRRFVIACMPGGVGLQEAFWPVFLEGVPSTGSTVEDGTSLDESANPAIFEEIKFRCRCSCRLVARSQVMGKSVRCPRCKALVIVKIGFRPETGDPVPLLSYPDENAASSEQYKQ